MDWFNFIASFFVITVSIVISYFFIKTVNLKKTYKSIMVGVLFGFVTIICNKFILKNYFNFANTCVLVSGILFGGPAGIVAGLIGAAERFIFIKNAALEITKLSVPITLIIAGLITSVIRRFIVVDKKVKWYFGFIVGAAIEMINVVLMIFIHINNIDSVYSAIKVYWLIEACISSASLAVVLVIFRLFFKQPVDKIAKPLGIQLKTQLSIMLSVLVGFTAVSSVGYAIFKDNSDKTTVSTITKTLEDAEENIVDDVNNDIAILIKELTKFMKQRSLQRDDYNEDNVPMGYKSFDDFYQQQTGELQFIADSRNVKELSIIRQDGTIKFTTSDYLRSLSNISEFNIPQFDITSDENVLVDAIKYQYNDYGYVDQAGANMKYVYGQMTKDNDTLYVLAGFDTDVYHSYIENSVNKGLVKRHVGEKGFLIVTDNEKAVLSTPTDLIGDKIDIDIENKQRLSLYNLNNEQYYSFIKDFGELNFVVLMNKEECDYNMNNSLKTTLLSEVGVFAILYLIIYLAIAFGVISPLKRVNKSLKSITAGNLEEKVCEHSNKELSALSSDINSTVESLKEYMGKEAKLIKKDLDFAKDIQLSALPKLTNEFIGNKYFDMYASMNTAKEVGGDFYDFELLDDKHLFILIADVSGKGVPAAMFMMQSKTIIRALVENSNQIDVAITKANEKLCESNSAGMFVTCWCGVINLETGIMQYVNAGHNPPLFKRNGGQFEYLSMKSGFVLAGLDGFKYTLKTIEMKQGDQLLLYTDGVTEAYSVKEELYGEERLLNYVNKINPIDSNVFCDAVLSDVKSFALGKEQSDDITMLHFKYLGGKE